MPTKEERRAELTAVYRQARACTTCPQLASTRTQVVFGAGNADADLMFVGEAPGAREDEQGIPFVGAAGKLLDELLAGVGLARADVFIANVLKCLRGSALVQLGDGSWAPIAQLVRARYSGTVMSVDGAGRVVRRRVVGWHESPLGGRAVHRLRYRSGRESIELTGDHEVLSERGFVAAAELRDGDRVATGQALTACAVDVACGSLLGGSAARVATVGGPGAFVSLSGTEAPDPPGEVTLVCAHTAGEEAYARFKASLIAELDAVVERRTVAAVAGGPPAQEAVVVRARAGRGLQILRAQFQRGAVPDWIAARLDARMLAFWFMDAGHLSARPGRPPQAQIAAQAFTDASRRLLLAALLRLGVRAQPAAGSLQLDAEATRRLSQRIAPYVPPVMRHKLHPDVAASVPYDPGALAAGERLSLFDAVEVRAAGEGERGDTTFFCIDVEQTHNFVTAGGVVHNCRPPGNRDPLPAEIESCSDYLMRQVALIEPRVICTLGNFATKLLRNDPTGITRLHGTAEIRVIGERAVRLYPLYHPAAALYTRALLDTLRADFARLPELLALPLPEQPQPAAPAPPPAAAEPEPQPEPEPPSSAQQLGLFEL